jgi:hypothetical protein
MDNVQKTNNGNNIFILVRSAFHSYFALLLKNNFEKLPLQLIELNGFKFP